MSSKIINPIKLRFDPKTDNLEEITKEIFQDDTARTLWLAIKQHHVVHQYFDQMCLDASKYIKRNGLPELPKKLNEVLRKIFGQLCNENNFNLSYCEELLPYLNGEKKLDYEVCKRE